MAEVCRRMVLLRPGIQSFVAQGISLEALKVLDHIITVNAYCRPRTFSREALEP